MKPLKEYLVESAKVEKRGRDPWVVLCERKDIDGETLTRDEFIKLMAKDLKTARREYEKLLSKSSNESRKKSFKTSGMNFDFNIFVNNLRYELILNCVTGKPNAGDLGSCYDVASTSPYWKNLKGWKFEYETHEGDHADVPFRAQCAPIFDDKTQKEYDRVKDNEDNAIARYYATSSYTGD